MMIDTSLTDWLAKIQALQAQSCPFVQVTLVDTIGSAPQEQGAKMLVTNQGIYAGTVGGGKIENRAILHAQQLLNTTAANPQAYDFQEWNLQRDIGMTCGGVVRVFFEVQHLRPWQVVVFGAGHTAQALIHVLLTLSCHITCLDTRPEWLARLPEHPALTKILANHLPDQVASLPDEAYVVLMTMGHSSDSPILLELLKTDRFAYIGAIGSDSKAHILRQDVLRAGFAPKVQQHFVCPIGLPIGDNSPAEIAISVVAQLLQVRDQHQGTRKRAPRSRRPKKKPQTKT